MSRIRTMKWKNFKKTYRTGGHGYRMKWQKIGKGELFLLIERRSYEKRYKNAFGKWFYLWRTVALKQGNKVKIIIDEELG